MTKLSKEQMILCDCGKECEISEEQQEVIDWAALICGVGSLFGPIGAAMFAGPGIALAVLSVICD